MASHRPRDRGSITELPSPCPVNWARQQACLLKRATRPATGRSPTCSSLATAALCRTAVSSTSCPSCATAASGPTASTTGARRRTTVHTPVRRAGRIERRRRGQRPFFLGCPPLTLVFARHGRDGHRLPAVRCHVPRASRRGRERGLRTPRSRQQVVHSCRVRCQNHKAPLRGAILQGEAGVQQLRRLQAVRREDLPQAPLGGRPRLQLAPLLISTTCLRIWCCRDGETGPGRRQARTGAHGRCTDAHSRGVPNLQLYLR